MELQVGCLLAVSGPVGFMAGKAIEGAERQERHQIRELVAIQILFGFLEDYPCGFRSWYKLTCSGGPDQAAAAGPSAWRVWCRILRYSLPDVGLMQQEKEPCV